MFFFALLVLASCELVSEEEDTSCDPADDPACVCTDDITRDECIKGGANCTCRDANATMNNMSTSDNASTGNNTFADSVELEPQPTSVTLAGDGNERRGWFCMVDRIEPRAGVTLDSGQTDPCGINFVIAGISSLTSDDSLIYFNTTGNFNLAEHSVGEVGEGPFPGTTALRLPVGTDVDLVLTSPVLGQNRYRAEFTLQSSNDAGIEVTISTVTMSVIPE